MNLIKQDLNVIIELTDMLHYAINNYPRLTKGLTKDELNLIKNISNSIDDYRISQTKLITV